MYTSINRPLFGCHKCHAFVDTLVQALGVSRLERFWSTVFNLLLYLAIGLVFMFTCAHDRM